MAVMDPLAYPRSGYDSVGGLVFLPRLLDKARLHAAGRLAGDYNLGPGYDARCCRLLGLAYDDVKATVARVTGALGAVGIAIMGDTDMRLALARELLDLLWVGAAAVGVDVCAVRVVVDHDKVGTEFAKDAGAGFVGGAIGTIQRDAE
jgi:hypothetical protein